MRRNFLLRRGVGGALCLVLALSLLPSPGLAQQGVEVPQTVEGAKTFGLGILNQLPSVMSEIFRDQALPILTKSFNWIFSQLRQVWESTLKNWVQGWIDRIREFLGQEIEARKPGIQQSLEEEKQELKEDLEELSLWEKLKSLIFD